MACGTPDAVSEAVRVTLGVLGNSDKERGFALGSSTFGSTMDDPTRAFSAASARLVPVA